MIEKPHESDFNSEKTPKDFTHFIFEPENVSPEDLSQAGTEAGEIYAHWNEEQRAEFFKMFRERLQEFTVEHWRQKMDLAKPTIIEFYNKWNEGDLRTTKTWGLLVALKTDADTIEKEINEFDQAIKNIDSSTPAHMVNFMEASHAQQTKIAMDIEMLYTDFKVMMLAIVVG